jgi:uncharacterized delta-60 repeat protein
MKLTFTLIALCFSILLNAQKAGTLDTTFGEQGKLLSTTSTGLPWPANSVVVKEDGAILVGSGEATAFLVKQFLNNGIPDSSFGIAGEARTVFKNYLEAYTTSVNITNDNKIIAAGIGDGGIGSHNSDILLARYLANGKADSSFGVNGSIAIDLHLIEVINCMKITNQGKILVAGYCAAGDEKKDNCFLAQFNSDGSVDTNFGDSGKVITDVGDSYQSYINSIAIAADGSIIAAGYAGYIRDFQQDPILLAKYDRNGKLTTDFGNSGLVFTRVSSNADYGYAVALQDDERIVVAGAANYKIQDSSAMVIVRYNSDGSLDKSFNNTGSLSVFFGTDNAVARALSVQPNGNYIIGGVKFVDYASPLNYAADDFAVASVTKDGKIDSSFGTNGITTTDFLELDDGCNALALQQDGKIIAAGGSTDVTNSITYITLARYNNDNTTKKQIIVQKIKHYIQTHNNAQATTLNTVSIYPNPAQNILHVQGLSSTQAKLTVVDFNGNVALSVQPYAFSASYNLNIASLHAGNYLLKIEANGAVVTKQFVKE